MLNLLTDRVSIERTAGSAVSDTGEITSPAAASWETTASNVPAYVYARSGNQRQRENGLAQPALYAGAFQVGTVLRADGYRYRVRAADGRRFDVTFVAERRGHHVEADLSLVIAA